MSDDLSGFSMMDLFRMEAEERLAVLSQGLVALEGTGARAEVIEPLMRAAHSLKGGGADRGPGRGGAGGARDGRLPGRGSERPSPAWAGTHRHALVGVDLLVQISKISEARTGVVAVVPWWQGRRSWWPTWPPSRRGRPSEPRPRRSRCPAAL